MKAMNLNYRLVMVFITLFVLSGLIVSGLVSPAPKAAGSSSKVVPIGNRAKPQKKIAAVPVTDKATDATPAVASLEVVNNQVVTFVPEFDDEWCKARYPEHYGEKFSLSHDDIVIKDKHGSKITDYNELSLKLSPGVAGSPDKSMERFEDAYIDVRGIGPMKIKSIKFNYSAAHSAGR